MAHWPPEQSEVEPLRRVFDPRVDRSGGADACWTWTGAKTKGGYGHILLRTVEPRREFLTHRLALYFAGIALVRSDKALHSCDNPPCCNPRHLRAGTQRENVIDSIVRKRHVSTSYECGKDAAGGGGSGAGQP